MSTIVDVSLAVKPAGSDTWVSIDPTSPTGQAFARRLGFTTSSKEDTMSAMPLEATPQERHLRIVENNKEQMGLLLKAREASRKAASWLSSLPKSAWTWLRRTLHLDPVLGIARDGIRFAKERATLVASHLGTSGMIGAGLLGVSTSTGRKVLGTLLSPVAWAARLFGKAYRWVEDRLFVEDEEKARFAGIRSTIWVQMVRLRQYVTGENRDDGGLVGKVAVLVAKYLYPVFRVDSVPMHAARTAGTIMTGQKIISGLALLPLGGFAMAARYIVTAGLGFLTVLQNLVFILRVRQWFEARFDKTEKVATGEDTKTNDVVDVMAAAAEAGEVIAHGAAPADANRATRRASDRPAKKRAGARR